MEPLFRKVVDIDRVKFGIDPDSEMLALGSCFAEEIGGCLYDRYFPIDLNPFGILFNPASIATALKVITGEVPFSDRVLVSQDGLWHSLLHHGSFSRPRRADLLTTVTQRIKQAEQRLDKLQVVLITLGSSHAYYHHGTDLFVANCHKIPQSQFDKRLLDLDDIVEMLDEALIQLWDRNAQVQVVLSVSPVRYWKDGAVQNQRSKARLLLACERLSTHYQNCHYFPAYELVIDELRDYRFFAEDMLHPNHMAVDFVWQSFQKNFVSKEGQDYMKQVEKLLKLRQHRPHHPNTRRDRERQEKIKTKEQELQSSFPHSDFKERKK